MDCGGAESSLCLFIYIYIYIDVCVFHQRAGSICLFFFNQHCNNFVHVTYLILGSYPVLCVKSPLPVRPLTAYVDWVSPCCILHTVSLMHSEWCITYIVLLEHGEYVSKERSLSTGMRTSESVSVCYV